MAYVSGLTCVLIYYKYKIAKLVPDSGGCPRDVHGYFGGIRHVRHSSSILEGLACCKIFFMLWRADLPDWKHLATVLIDDLLLGIDATQERSGDGEETSDISQAHSLRSQNKNERSHHRIRRTRTFRQMPSEHIFRKYGPENKKKSWER